MNSTNGSAAKRASGAPVFAAALLELDARLTAIETRQAKDDDAKAP